MRETILEVKNVTKVYKLYHNNLDRLKEIFLKKKYHKEFFANKNISFNLFKNETLGIIGLNGAGKSTLLKIISGVIDLTDGDVVKKGRVTALLELGTGFNFELNGIENIYLNGMLIGMNKTEIDKKLKKIIEFSELGDYIQEPVKTYSSGMVMRLAFSIAIFSEPDIFIVDEALSVGDAHFSAKCTKALKEKKASNMSIIYVSHDLNSLKLLCDRVILLDRGEIVKDGNPEDVINFYNFLIADIDKKDLNLKKIDTSFGTFDATILGVEVLGNESKSNILSSGEEGVIRIKVESKKEIKNVTVGILIRDRFGQDIFGTNSFYYNKTINLQKDHIANIEFKMKFNIGIGKYTITAAIHDNENHIQNCYHWIDFASEFEIAGIKGPFFNGISRLEPTITIY